MSPSKSPDEAKKADALLVQIFIGIRDGGKAVDRLRALILFSRNEAELKEFYPLIRQVKRVFDVDLMKWTEEPEHAFLIARSFELHGGWKEARDRYQKIINTPGISREILAQAKWRLGECLARLHGYQRAIALLEEVRGMS